MPNSDVSQQHCAFVSLLGAPNAGKSTLLNQLVQSKISIVSPKVQTTRSVITGICTEGVSQLVFMDTPGIFIPDPNRKLERAMVKSAWDRIEDADICCLLIDVKKGVSEDTALIIQGFKDHNIKAVLILNKIDTTPRDRLLGLSEKLFSEGVFSDIFMISALKGDGVDDVRDFLAKKAPQGPWMYPEDQLSTAPSRFVASEVTREQLFYRLQQELPYSLTVETEQFEERKGSVKIHQTIYVQREGHKKIVLGKSGQGIKEIGQRARKELESILGCKVHLFLFVKVRENWMQNSDHYNYMGLEMPK